MVSDSPIFKTAWGHVNLDHLTRLSEPEFLDRMGRGGWFVRFFGWFQLHDKPMEFCREVSGESESRLAREGNTYWSELALADGSWARENEIYWSDDEPERILAVQNMRREHWKPLMNAWQTRLRSQDKKV